MAEGERSVEVSPDDNNTGIVADDIVVSYYDVAVRRSDLLTLGPDQFIKDTILSFWAEHLQRSKFPHNETMLFLSPTIVHHLKLARDTQQTLSHINAQRKSFIFLPVNDSENEGDMGSHWFILIFSRPDKRCYALDSSYKPEFVSKLHALYERFNDQLNMGSTVFENFKCIKQKNSFDCGLHVMSNALHFAEHINATNTCGTMPSMDQNQLLSREEIEAAILNVSADGK